MRGSSGGRSALALAARGARLAGHVVVAALCFELAARLDDRLSFGAPFWAHYDADGLRSKDADGLVRNVPGARFEKWEINRLGFRGEVVAAEKPAGRRRVACLGTSESFGLYEQEGSEWPAQLGHLLRARHHDADEFNASVVGLNRDTRQGYIDRYVMPLRPDAIVLYLDVISDATSRLRAAPRGAAETGAPAGGPIVVPLRDRLPTSRALPKLSRSLKATLPASLWNPIRTWRLARSVARRELAMPGGQRPLDAVPVEAVEAFRRHLRKLVETQRQQGVAPILVTYPTLGTIANRASHRLEFLALREWHAELSDLGLIDAASRLNDVVRDVARELAVPLADADAAVPKTSEHFADYVHYTDAGAELVAASVLAALERGGVLEPHGP